MTQSIVLYEVKDGVGTISFNRPKVKNAINLEMHDALQAALEQANEDPNVRVIVLTGTGDAFSAGADLKSFLPALQDGSLDYGKYLKDTYNKNISYLARIEKPTVAYINGVAVGAGLSFALACDFRVAEYDSKLGLGFLKIGLVPDAGASFFLPRLVGLSKALELSLGDIISAEEAYRIGLINKIGNPDEFVAQLKLQPLEAYGLTKRNLKASYENSLEKVLKMEEEAQSKAGRSDDHHAAVANFFKK